MQEVRVNIKGIVNLPIAELNAFQEDIKTLPEENYQRLKTGILEDGFSFSPHVFMDGNGKAWLLDGHQRFTCLTKMEGEGFRIPTIPCMEVEAEDLEHARRLVLAAASQFGVFKVNKLMDFVKKTSLEPTKLVDRFVLPAVRLDRITGVSAHTRKVSEGAQEISSDKFDFDHECPKCKHKWND